jgi:hypothetical protein
VSNDKGVHCKPQRFSSFGSRVTIVMLEIMGMQRKKGWPTLSSATSAAPVLCVASCIMTTIILVGCINLLFAFSSLQIPGIMDKNMNTSSKTGINNTGQYTNANNTQDWKDPENNVRIHFAYLPEYPLPDNITKQRHVRKTVRLKLL